MGCPKNRMAGGGASQVKKGQDHDELDRNKGQPRLRVGPCRSMEWNNIVTWTIPELLLGLRKEVSRAGP